MLLSGCRGQVKKVLAKMVRPRGKFKGDLYFERGLHASLQNETTSHKVTSGSEWLSKSGQEPAPKRGIAGSDAKVGSGKSGCPVLSSLLQPTIPCTQTKQQVETDFGLPGSIEKVIPVPRSLHPHLRWWLEESNVLPRQPLHPLKHTLQIFTDTSKEGWGTHLNELTASGTWSVPESKLHFNYLELKTVFLVFQSGASVIRWTSGHHLGKP